MRWGYYSHLHPDTLTAIRQETPIAYLPWGALEWHGPHLPFGTDGLIAEAIAKRVAERVGGVVLPTTWWPITPLPNQESIAVSSAIIRNLWEDLFAELSRAQWSLVVAITGHCSHGHEIILMETAKYAIREHNLLVLAISPFSLVDEKMLDHAALWETSLMMTLHPDLVRMEALGKTHLSPDQSAVLGSDPRGRASASIGTRALRMSVEHISRATRRLLATKDEDSLFVLYESLLRSHQSYIKHYMGDTYEEANRAWWDDICRHYRKEHPPEEQSDGDPPDPPDPPSRPNKNLS
jgi:creatinine amidohydrolase